MTGTIYFVQDYHQTAVKIGYAREAGNRIMSLQTASPYPLLPMGTCPGNMSFERSLHAEFASDRLLGEWFRKTDELVERAKHLCDDFHECIGQRRRILILAKRRGWIPAVDGKADIRPTRPLTPHKRRPFPTLPSLLGLDEGWV